MNAIITYFKKYGPLSLKTQEELKKVTCVRYVKARTLLQSDKAICDQILYVRKGLVHVFQNCGNSRKTKWLAQEDQLLCAFNHFLKQEYAGVNYETIEACEIHSITYSSFQQLMKYEDFKYLVNQIIIEKLCHINHFLSENTGAAKLRYQRFLNYFPALASRVPVNIIASFLDVSCKTISRLRSGRFMISEYKSGEQHRMAV